MFIPPGEKPNATRHEFGDTKYRRVEYSLIGSSRFTEYFLERQKGLTLAAATTMWAAALLVALPYVIVMARGPGIAFDAVAVLIISGSLVAAALTALGLAISSFSMSNRMSLAAALSVMLLLAAPSQLPAVKVDGVMGTVLIRANPVSSGLRLAKRILVDNAPWSSEWTYVMSPLIAAIGLTILAISLSRRLELGGSR